MVKRPRWFWPDELDEPFGIYGEPVGLPRIDDYDDDDEPEAAPMLACPTEERDEAA